jgi:hypothetical protein
MSLSLAFRYAFLSGSERGGATAAVPRTASDPRAASRATTRTERPLLMYS